MENAMEGIDTCIIYIDDLLIHTDTHDKHLASLELVMERLAQHGLKINLDKWFSVTKKSVTSVSR